MSAALRVEISTAGWATAITVTPPAGPAPLDAWLPLLQALASQVSQAADRAAAEAGTPVACAKGCGSCCRQLVAISPVEARALAKLVDAMPQPQQAEVRARFAAALARLAESGVTERDHAAADTRYPLAETPQQRLAAEWFALQIACPFLEEEACGIYQDRPLVCREHLVTSPAANCARLFRDPVDRIELPVRLGPALARAAEVVAGVSTAMVPLVMSLDLPAVVGAALDRPRDPRRTLEAILTEIGDWRIEAVE
ncbi:MAG TPA: YkgJ family cysteine cluster protein [Caulobacteraceae bacterium]|nr:YkgJ family cysteine cluster protein [Caulobacteraceae bacterium]